MSIATAIQAAQQKVANAYSSVSSKGGTLPTTQNLSNLPSAIESIPAGGGSKYGCTVDNFLGDVDANGVLQQPSNTTGDIVFNGVKDVGDNALAYKFYNNTKLTHGVSFPDLEKVSGSDGCYYMFYNCQGLTSVSFPNLTTVSGNNGCNYMFRGCQGLTSVSFPNLTTISGNSAFSRSFASCANIEHIYFPALNTSSFGSYTNQFLNMMLSIGTTKTHTIHFPSNLESTISGLTGYPLFGGTSGYVTIAFDQPATS